MCHLPGGHGPRSESGPTHVPVRVPQAVHRPVVRQENVVPRASALVIVSDLIAVTATL